ncbi:MAG: hypothetical protein Q8R36_00060 [bacterium]|nr:hypothetical protein [bacterium]
MFEDKEVRTIGQHFNMKTFISFIIGAVFGVLFAVPLVERGLIGTDFIAKVIEKKVERAETTPEAIVVSSGTSNVSSAFRTGEYSLVVADQKAGFSVIMSMVLLPQSGWVAIHEEGEEGNIGNILGARRFTEGKYFGSAIDLLRETEGEKKYYAVLHEDDGNNVFNFEIEKPALDSFGAVIMEKFIALP